MTVGIFGDSKLSKLAKLALAKHMMHNSVSFFTQNFSPEEGLILNEENFKNHHIHSFFLGSVGYKLIHMKENLAIFLQGINMPFQEILDQDAYFPHTNLFERGVGNWVMERATIQANTKLGDFNIMWPGSILSHDSVIGDYNWISPGAIICGEVEIGSHNFIGAGAIIASGTKIGDGNLLAAGSVNTKAVAIDEVRGEGYNNVIDRSAKEFWSKL